MTLPPVVPREAQWTSKPWLIAMGVLLFAFLVIGIEPFKYMGQDCGSVFFPKSSTLQAEFGELANLRCGGKSDTRRLLMVLCSMAFLIFAIAVLRNLGRMLKHRVHRPGKGMRSI